MSAEDAFSDDLNRYNEPIEDEVKVRPQDFQIQLPRKTWRVHTQRAQHQQPPLCNLEAKYPKRNIGNESVQTKLVEMAGGKADFNQTITLPINMYYDQSSQLFQEKKTLFTFTMQTPKGQKQAGVVYVEVAQMLNNKQASLANDYPLQKCPVKGSKVNIEVTAELIGEAALSDSQSIDSIMFQMQGGPSTLSIESKKTIPESKIKEEEKTSKVVVQENSSQLEEKNKIIGNLQSQVKKLTKDNEKLTKQLQRQRSIKGQSQTGVLKQQLLKSKGIQQKLQTEINNLRNENIQHQRELQKMRIRMEQIYELLFSNLNSLY